MKALIVYNSLSALVFIALWLAPVFKEIESIDKFITITLNFWKAALIVLAGMVVVDIFAVTLQLLNLLP